MQPCRAALFLGLVVFFRAGSAGRCGDLSGMPDVGLRFRTVQQPFDVLAMGHDEQDGDDEREDDERRVDFGGLGREEREDRKTASGDDRAE